jgi:hypothetical protein
MRIPNLTFRSVSTSTTYSFGCTQAAEHVRENQTLRAALAKLGSEGR